MVRGWCVVLPVPLDDLKQRSTYVQFWAVEELWKTQLKDDSGSNTDGENLLYMYKQYRQTEVKQPQLWTKSSWETREITTFQLGNSICLPILRSMVFFCLPVPSVEGFFGDIRNQRSSSLLGQNGMTNRSGFSTQPTETRQGLAEQLAPRGE